MIFEARVKTGRNEFAIIKADGGFEISVRSQPREGEANAEIVRELKRLTGRSAFIVKGAKSKRKTISIEGLDEGGFEDFYESCH